MDINNVNLYAHIEDLFECSGMCKSSLFYFGLPITKGYPEQTCIHHFKDYLDTSAGSFAKASVMTGLIFLFIFFMHFGLYCRDKNHQESEEKTQEENQGNSPQPNQSQDEEEKVDGAVAVGEIQLQNVNPEGGQNDSVVESEVSVASKTRGKLDF